MRSKTPNRPRKLGNANCGLLISNVERPLSEKLTGRFASISAL